MKTNKRKVRKCLKCVKQSSRRFDLANGKYLSILLGLFARIVKITHLTLDKTVHEVKLNNEGGGEFNETKRSEDKTKIGKEHETEKTNKF